MTKIIESDTYNYDYTDHVTTFGKIIKILFEDAQYLWNNPEKKVQVLKSEKEGRMTLIPFLQIEYGLQNFILKYRYYEKGYRPKLFLYDDECSILLKFTSIGGILTFLDQTLFSEGFSLQKGENQNIQRDFFRDQFMTQVIHKIEDSIKSKSTLAYYDAMKTLFYLPESVAAMFNENFLWNLMEMAMNRDSLTNTRDLAEENIFVKLIRIILQKEGQEVRLMNWFLENIKDGEKNITKFEFIYDRINGDNFLEFAKLISQVWKKSRFIYPDTEKNPEFATTDGPLFLPYTSEKAFGFYFSNVSMSFESHKQKGRLLKTLYDTGRTETEMRPGLKTDNLVPTQVPIIDQFWYHPFYPIYLKDIENQETEMKLDSVVPAFMLKANRDKQFWSNVIRSAEYAADILTTVSGVGNIAKFRYLAKFATKASKLRFVSKAGRAVATARKVVAATAAVVEITSGTVNTLLKLTGARDAKWGKALSEYLFWLELLSLSGELSVAIHNGLRKSAKEILKNENDIRKSAKNADEAKEIDDIIDELEKVAGRSVAEGSGSTKYIIKAKHLDDTGALEGISKIEKEIIEEPVEYGAFVDHKGKVISEKFTDNSPKGLSIPAMLDLSTRKYIRIFTHNHPTSTPLSSFDIMTFIKGNMQEMRAICRNGDIYALIKKGDLPSEGDDWTNFLRGVIKKVKDENAELIIKAQKDKNAKLLYDQKIADTFIDELGELVEYIKYQ